MGKIARFESLVAQLVEGTFGRIFSDTLQPVEVVASDQIPRGRISVAAQYVAQETAPIGPTEEIAPDAIRRSLAALEREPAYLILDGKRHLPLKRPVVALGRALDNDVVIDDTRVSRHHAQLRLRNGQYILYDTGSSGGTAVNGEPAAERALRSGDVISLAGYAMVYFEDNPPPADPPVTLEDTPMME